MSTETDHPPSDIDTALRQLIREVVRQELQRAVGEARNDAEVPTVGEAAAVAKLSRQTVRLWIREGRLAASGASKLMRVRRADLDAAFGAPRRREPTHRELTPEELAHREFEEEQRSRWRSRRS